MRSQCLTKILTISLVYLFVKTENMSVMCSSAGENYWCNGQSLMIYDSYWARHVDRNIWRRSAIVGSFQNVFYNSVK
jgi:hypothetical protein